MEHNATSLINICESALKKAKAMQIQGNGLIIIVNTREKVLSIVYGITTYLLC